MTNRRNYQESDGQRQAMIDCAASNQDGLAYIQDLNDAREVVRAIAPMLSITRMVWRIGFSQHQSELMYFYLKNFVREGKKKLEEVALALHEYERSHARWIGDAGLTRFADEYWSRTVRKRIVGNDFSRAWNDLSIARSGVNRDGRRAASGWEKHLAASFKTLHGLVAEVHQRMCEKVEGVKPIERDFLQTHDGMDYWVLCPWFAQEHATFEANFSDPEKGIDRTGQMILVIRKWHNDDRNRRRAAKSAKRVAAMETVH